MTPNEERFWAKVTPPTTKGCRLWTASKNEAGYGYFGIDGKNKYAHRVIWEWTYGPIPKDLEIDHIVCDNTSCVNIKHLKLSTSRANTLRSKNGTTAVNARKTECLRGHPLSGPNLRIDSTGRRICRTCKRAENQTDRARARKARWAREHYQPRTKT
jgi:hypothetical protein